MKIEVSETDMAQIDNLLGDIKNGATKAMVTSINSTLVTVNTQAAKSVGAYLALTAKRIKQNFRVTKANYSKVSGEFASTGKPIGLINYAARQLKSGVSFKVLRTGSRKTLKHAFIARGKGKEGDGTRSDKLHVWWRAVVWKRPINPSLSYSALPRMFRFPDSGGKEKGILRRTGPRIEDALGSNNIFQPLQELAGETFQKNLGIKIDDILRRHNG